MSRKRRAEQRGAAAAAPPNAREAGALALAVALGAASALWSLFQWTQLLIARSGGQPFCGLGTGDGCETLWDSPFASAVQAATGLPVAAWGLVWSLAALALPLVALWREARGASGEPFASATRVTALAGVAAVMGLAGVSLREQQLCTNCALTYALVIAYAAASLWPAGRLGAAHGLRGAALAGGAALLTFLALLPVGLRTPPAGPAQEPLGLPEGASQGALEQLVANLSPPLQQGLADALAAYRASPIQPLPPPRALVGPSDAPVRITEFTDVLCSHCAALHTTLAQLRSRAPGGAFALDAHQFPLDGSCNPLVEGTGAPVRCLGARVLLCAEGRPFSFELASALYARQRELDEPLVYELASRFMPREAIASCVDSPEITARLEADIELARQLDIRGTPLVLVNGRQAPSHPLFLFAIVLGGGDAGHAAFAALPAPRAQAEAEAH